MKREIVQIITKSTLVSELIEEVDSWYLMSISIKESNIGVVLYEGSLD